MGDITHLTFLYSEQSGTLTLWRHHSNPEIFPNVNEWHCGTLAEAKTSMAETARGYFPQGGALRSAPEIKERPGLLVWELVR